MASSRRNEITFRKAASVGRAGRRGDVRTSVSPSLSAGTTLTDDSEPASQIRKLCDGGDHGGTAYRMAAHTAAASIAKVISAESYLRDAAISLGQEEELTRLISELHDVCEALRVCGGQNTSLQVAFPEHMDSIKPALPQWWFALSEMLQTTEHEIDLLASIGHGQSRNTDARILCNIVVRVLRRHYQLMLAEAEDWLDMADV